MCNDMSAFSRVKEGEILLMWQVYFPRWVIISMYREYRAVITIFTPIRIIVMLDHEKVDITTNSSPIKLIVGGRAKLVRLASSHQVAISGRSVCRPRARIMVRLWIRSQFEFARQKSMEDVRPWAIIRAVAPMQLQGVWIRMATITSAMWLTEEYAMSDFRSV